ncbi:hypothetical protein WN944_004128 [Citrus x changshan-huyou]|uniref:Protein kinase domain-containing protein n=1 Tax=Citrus x changshan-huyou TaxID=2935761 RepID=A0AAP0M1A6_9ROSI
MMLSAQFTQCSYFGMPDADTLPEVALLSDHSWRKPSDELNLAEELTRLEPDGLDLLFESRPHAAVKNFQKQDSKLASGSSPSSDQGVYSSQIHDRFIKCLQYETDQIVAIKNIEVKAPSEGVQSSVMREVALFKKSLDVQSDLKRENLVFEYVNINLHKFIQQYHPMDSHLIKKFLYCILSGISYCHARKIIHRDLTTMNLLADIENKTVKIAADSGMAKEIDAPFDAHTTEYVTTMNSIECLHIIFLNDTVNDYDTFGTSLQMVILSYFGMPDANTLPEVTSLSDSDHSLLTPIETVNLAEELTRLDPWNPFCTIGRYKTMNCSHLIGFLSCVGGTV